MKKEVEELVHILSKKEEKKELLKEIGYSQRVVGFEFERPEKSFIMPPPAISRF